MQKLCHWYTSNWQDIWIGCTKTITICLLLTVNVTKKFRILVIYLLLVIQKRETSVTTSNNIQNFCWNIKPEKTYEEDIEIPISSFFLAYPSISSRLIYLELAILKERHRKGFNSRRSKVWRREIFNNYI